MSWSQKQKERWRIAFGLNPHDPERDPLPRAAALKSWHARWDAPRSGGYYKSLDGLTRSQQALGYRTPQSQRSTPQRPRKRVVPIFSTTTATNHRQNNAVVDVRADGDHIYAGEYAVKSISPAGQDRYGFDLVELKTDLATYIVNKSVLKG